MSSQHRHKNRNDLTCLGIFFHLESLQSNLISKVSCAKQVSLLKASTFSLLDVQTFNREAPKTSVPPTSQTNWGQSSDSYLHRSETHYLNSAGCAAARSISPSLQIPCKRRVDSGIRHITKGWVLHCGCSAHVQQLAKSQALIEITLLMWLTCQRPNPSMADVKSLRYTAVVNSDFRETLFSWNTCTNFAI